MSINASVHSTKVCKVQPSSSVRPPLPVETPPVRLAATRVMDRRQALAFPCLMAMAASLTGSASPALAVDDFVTTPSGLRVQTLKEGTGAQPKAGEKPSTSYCSACANIYLNVYNFKQVIAFRYTGVDTP